MSLLQEKQKCDHKSRTVKTHRYVVRSGSRSPRACAPPDSVLPPQPADLPAPGHPANTSWKGRTATVSTPGSGGHVAPSQLFRFAALTGKPTQSMGTRMGQIRQTLIYQTRQGTGFVPSAVAVSPSSQRSCQMAKQESCVCRNAGF